MAVVLLPMLDGAFADLREPATFIPTVLLHRATRPADAIEVCLLFLGLQGHQDLLRRNNKRVHICLELQRDSANVLNQGAWFPSFLVAVPVHDGRGRRRQKQANVTSVI